MNILITGIHGFVGTNLVQSLKSNHTIYGLDIVSPAKEGVVQTYGWNELEALPPIDAVIHLAGKAHDTKNQTVAQTYFDINTGLTQKIYDWFLASEASKFVFFSSVKAAADKVEGEILTEDVVPTPVGPYGESKIAAEGYILGQQTTDEVEIIKGQATSQSLDEPFKRQGSRLSPTNFNPSNGSEANIPPMEHPEQNGKRDSSNSQIFKSSNFQTFQTLQTKQTFILRPCMIHGPGNKGNLNLLYNVVKRGIPYPLGAFENRRSFCSIYNLSFVIGALMEQNIESGIYNVGDDETLSTNELIALIANTLHKPNRTWKWNAAVIRLVARVGSVLHLPLNEERLQKLTENYVVSNSKLKRALGIERMPVRAQEGFAKTIRSFME